MSSNLLADNAITMYRGSSKTLLLSVTDEDGAVQPLTGAKIYFTVKCDLKDEYAKIQKSTDQPTQIEIYAPLDGKAKIYLGPADTQSLDLGIYIYDVWVELSSGKRYPVIKPSTFKVEAGVTVLQ